MKTIYIMLTKYKDFGSQLLALISGRGYTHSSVALEEDANRFFSFNVKGFAVESLEKYKRHGVEESKCFQLEVSDEAYANIKSDIEYFLQNKSEFRYSKFGLFCCALRIPFHRDHYYFCSEFVAQILQQAGAMQFKRDTSCYFPNHFVNMMSQFNGTLRVMENPV